MEWGRWRGCARLALAMLAGAGAAGARPAAVTIDGLHLARVDTGAALVLRTTSPLSPRVVALAGPRGELLRLTVDLPREARLAPKEPRQLRGEPPIARVRVGQAADGRVRMVLDLADADAYAVRRDPARRATAIVVRRRTRAPATQAADAPPAPARPAPAVVVRPRRPHVVLDPGHGGDDPGAIGFAVEKHVTLDVARRLARRLHDELGVRVTLTRAGDATVSLAERTAVANRGDTDLFVSIHANSNPTGRLHGIETYVLDDTGDHATLRLAAIENGAAARPVDPQSTDLRYILSSLVQGGKMAESSRLAGTMQRELVRYMKARYPDVTDLGVKRGPFYVLVGSHVPCILVETSFLSHAVEGRRLAEEAYRAALAEGLFQGIRRFLAERDRARTL